ncbi:adenylate/guanylate cyclase domain-containing protein [Rhizobium sp. PL01]|uniref:adenylate/guanylate cyclase domain-containing protein n=1 Tax=Rhizobium sp. PL01 TaxID=3085631 RepID=UPI00298193E9|nr:adenylate/guanylate cyclase domain-containing protein [Rhizobium sp. PL01]MDW5317033.1 adenylate/guanylate cyclase domain-containing protein [Rhizobium sp. PL01]
MIERRLAAIFAADVEGYSRLMSQDEVGTLEALASQRAILDECVAEHRGRIANTAGDSVLAEFPSAVNAVKCALEAQTAMAAANKELPIERCLWFRIGVHVGDVMVRGGDLFGDGVNIAARLQAIAEPGGICLSAMVQDYVRSAILVAVNDLGPQSLKGIKLPIRVFAIKHGSAPSQRSSFNPNWQDRLRADRPSVAVLPFKNMGGPEQEYFSDGITEDIITELARFRELLVIARNSSFAFQDKAVEISAIGKALGADYVVEGSIRRSGDRVRVTAQLIKAETGTHLWAERYDRSFEEVFAIQDDVARGVVATVAQRIQEETEVVARRRPPQDIMAYDLFLQGQRLSDVFVDNGQERSRDFFERARTLDPTFARAYTGLAFNYLNRSLDFGVGVPHEEDTNRKEARRLAELALTVDPTEPRVQSTAGYIFLTWREFDRASRHFDLASSMNPNDATIQIFWAWAQACLGRPELGIPATQMAFRLNPRHPHWYSSYCSRVHFLLRQYDEAIKHLAYRMSGDPTYHIRDMSILAAAFGHMGRREEALQCATWFIEGIRKVWRGNPNAGPADYAEWLINTSYLKLPADEALLREGLRLAGLPVNDRRLH